MAEVGTGASYMLPDRGDWWLPSADGADSHPSSGWGFVSGEIRGGCVPAGVLRQSVC